MSVVFGIVHCVIIAHLIKKAGLAKNDPRTLNRAVGWGLPRQTVDEPAKA
jgi:hypothetical protein